MMSKRTDKRSAARVVREQIEREKRRKRNMWIAIGAVGVLVIGSVVGWTIYSNSKATDVAIPAGANAEGTAIVTGTGPVAVEEYLDFICPFCKTFHDDASATLNQMITENKIKVVTHPVAYLDRYSTNRYSTRASAASGCAADDGKFNEYVSLLYANQPAENSAGPTDEDLINLGTSNGLSESFAQCVRDKKYVTWAAKVSNEASKSGITGTPTVLVNGKKVQANAAAIVAAVNSAGTATPSPTS